MILFWPHILKHLCFENSGLRNSRKCWTMSLAFSRHYLVESYRGIYGCMSDLTWRTFWKDSLQTERSEPAVWNQPFTALLWLGLLAWPVMSRNWITDFGLFCRPCDAKRQLIYPSDLCTKWNCPDKQMAWPWWYFTATCVCLNNMVINLSLWV